jgi:hypothetical protein
MQAVYPMSPSLTTSVLVLNRMYMAVRVVSAKRALTMLFRQMAEVDRGRGWAVPVVRLR